MITKTSWKTGLELKATQTNIPETGILVKQKLCSSIYKGSKRVIRSTLAGETLAMAEGTNVAIFMSTVFTGLTTGTPAPDGLPLICMTVANHFMML
ncbi:hypothetical protein RRG08_010002 [Elysia crispata]|uniref:Uncharacterized protein n=1 Tax=Elysia crispata TaxID=231223 RepID=A0AAE0YPY2_9GAST|nr:hypothetical protein RRG08_010002 [Elysia crispata]